MSVAGALSERDEVTADGPGVAGRPPARDFEVHLGVYDGPFDVLLGLIGKHKLDVTEVALAQVTDEFLAYVREGGFDLEQTTSFLVVAATLLDLKAARLLPGESVDDEDLALLEARDLLFARLLQYRAFKQVAGWLAGTLEAQRVWYGRAVGLPPEVTGAEQLPPLELDLRQLVRLAAAAFAPKAAETVDIGHVHAARISVADAVATLSERLVALGSADFSTLCDDCAELIEVVVRFLGVLELFREGRVGLDQSAPLADLRVTWLPEAADITVGGS